MFNLRMHMMCVGCVCAYVYMACTCACTFWYLLDESSGIQCFFLLVLALMTHRSSLSSVVVGILEEGLEMFLLAFVAGCSVSACSSSWQPFVMRTVSRGRLSIQMAQFSVALTCSC